MYRRQRLWRYDRCGRLCSTRVRSRFPWTIARQNRWHRLCQWKIYMGASSVLVCDFAGFVQELHFPVFGAIQRYYLWRAITPGIDKIELDSSFAFAITLATILTMRPCFVAFQVTFAAGKTARPHTLRLAALTTVVAIAGVHRVSRGIRFWPNSFDFLARLCARVVRWGFALVGDRRVRFWVGLVYSGRSRGAGSQWIGICRSKIRLRIRRLIFVGGQDGRWMARRPGYAPLRGSP
jgi:hypothetical protein